MSFGRPKIVLVSAIVVAILLLSGGLTSANAQQVDLREYIAGPNFQPHTLSTGEAIRFTGEGGVGPGTAVRQYKNSNYEQFFIAGDGVYRREDTSWALGGADVQCSIAGGKAVYTLYPGCQVWGEGQQVTGDGARWTPVTASVGQSWVQQTHQIVTIGDPTTTGIRNACSINRPGYSGTNSCNQAPVLTLVNYYPAGTFTFCTGIVNAEDVIQISGSGGAGANDGFLYMKGWGLVGFEDERLEVGLMGPGADPSQCSGGGPSTPDTPFDIFDVPCNETYQSRGLNDGREYHSLRPYPASPCDRNYDESIQTYMCGHRLIAKQVFEVTPADATGWDGGPTCEETPEGALFCRYEFESSVRIGVDLTNAELPIAGNTEDVPNAESAASRLSFAQRVNNYISWYLNGTTSRAEEVDETIKTSPPYPTLNVTPAGEVLQRVNEIINLSGPLKKLLPFAIQNGEFLISNQTGAIPIEDQPGLRGNQKNQAGSTRHNQIAVCEVYKLFSYLAFPVQCYRGQDQVKWRLTQIDPFVNVPGFSILPIPTYNPLFSFIPFSSTEDLVGRGRVDNVAPGDLPGGGLAGDPSASTAEIVPIDPAQPDTPVRFTPTGAVDEANRSYHSLYFAHMQEDTELAESLQRTFLPQGSTGDNGDISLFVPPPYCEILESRTNPGDDLHGEYANGRDPIPPEPEQPGGNVDYKVRFSCLFPPPPPPDDPAFIACVEACIRDGGTVDICTDSDHCGKVDATCQKNALVAMSVEVGTPKADTLWNRLVWGTESVFRRIFPRVEQGAPVDFIEDLPAHTNATYAVSPLSAPPVIVGTEALAGDPELSRPGTQARLYFPHLGGIHEYFLQGIQCALRPLGMCEDSEFSGGGIGNTSGM